MAAVAVTPNFNPLASPHERAMCGGKRTYYSRRSARNAAKVMNLGAGYHGDDRVSDYRCQYCWYFHIGHSEKQWRVA
jgi:hypothetical protein